MKTKNVSAKKERFIKGEDITAIQNDSINISESDTIEEMFRNEQFQQQTDTKELFHEKTVKARTDLSARQVKLVTKCYYLGQMLQIPELNVILADFLTLSISKDRKSRAEFVEALKSRIDNQIQTNQMGLRGQFGK